MQFFEFFLRNQKAKLSLTHHKYSLFWHCIQFVPFLPFEQKKSTKIALSFKSVYAILKEYTVVVKGMGMIMEIDPFYAIF